MIDVEKIQYMFEFHSPNGLSELLTASLRPIYVLPDPDCWLHRPLHYDSVGEHTAMNAASLAPVRSVSTASASSSILTIPLEDQDICELLQTTDTTENAIFTIYGKAIDIECSHDLSQYWSEDLMYRGIELIYVVLDDWELRQVALEAEPRLVMLPPMQLTYMKHADAFVATFKAYLERIEVRVHVTFTIDITTQSMHVMRVACAPHSRAHLPCCCCCCTADPSDVVYLRFFHFA